VRIYITKGSDLDFQTVFDGIAATAVAGILFATMSYEMINRGLLTRIAAYGPLLLSLLWLGGFPCTPTAQHTVTAQTDGNHLKHQDLEQDEWRRTIHGWEKKTSWSRPTKLPAATRLHPALLASIQVLISLGSLFAFSNLDSTKSRSKQVDASKKNQIRQASGEQPSEKQ